VAPSSSADLLKGGRLNGTLNFLSQNDIFFKTGITRSSSGAAGLNLPDGADPRDFERALGLAENNNLEEYYTVMVQTDDLPPNLNDEERIIALSSIFIVAPFMLYNMYQFLTKTVMEMQVLHGDETHKVVSGDYIFILWGTNLIDVSHHRHTGLITHQFRPFLYQITKKHNSLCCQLALKTLKKLSLSLFQLEFSPKFAVFDFSSALRCSVSEELPETVLARCWLHILGAFCRPEWVARRIRLPATNRKPIIRAIVNLHHCITLPQFCKLEELYCSQWEHELDEGNFATYYEGNLGSKSECKGMWWIGCMGLLGLTPDNQAVEGYFRQMKGNAASISGKQRSGSVFRLNQELDHFMKYELPILVG
jgi:hypothetical protein